MYYKAKMSLIIIKGCIIAITNVCLTPSEAQYGFVPYKSTITNLLRFTNFAINAFDQATK